MSPHDKQQDNENMPAETYEEMMYRWMIECFEKAYNNIARENDLRQSHILLWERYQQWKREKESDEKEDCETA